MDDRAEHLQMQGAMSRCDALKRRTNRRSSSRVGGSSAALMAIGLNAFP
jgi:hypothetical protein